jgi:GTP-binding protein EngB required for normal cell division
MSNSLVNNKEGDMEATMDFLKEAILAAEVVSIGLDKMHESETCKESHLQENRLRAEIATLYALLAISSQLQHIVEVLQNISEHLSEQSNENSTTSWRQFEF